MEAVTTEGGTPPHDNSGHGGIKVEFMVTEEGDDYVVLQLCSCPTCTPGVADDSEPVADDSDPDEYDDDIDMSPTMDKSFDLEDEYIGQMSKASGTRSGTSSGRRAAKHKKAKPPTGKVRHTKVNKEAERMDKVRINIERMKVNKQFKLEMAATLGESGSLPGRVRAELLGLDQATYNLLLSLEGREITPNDYDLLLTLDSSVKKNTVSKKKLKVFPTRAATEADTGDGKVCLVCHDEFSVGEELRELPCGHVYHKLCIDVWLTESAEHCPVDRLSVHSHDH